MGVVSLMSSAARRSIQAWSKRIYSGFCVSNQEEQPRCTESDRLADGRGCQDSLLFYNPAIYCHYRCHSGGGSAKSNLILATMILIRSFFSAASSSFPWALSTPTHEVFGTGTKRRTSTALALDNMPFRLRSQTAWHMKPISCVKWQRPLRRNCPFF